MKKILILDDAPNTLMSLEFLMKKNGFQVFIARDSMEAKMIIDTERPEIVIIDIMMHQVDGDAVFNHIKQKKQLNTKVIFLIAKGKEKEVAKGYKAGVDLYLTKPFSTKKVVEKINELVNAKP